MEGAMATAHVCSIIPKRILDKLARDKKLSGRTRKAFAETARLEAGWRRVRAAHNDNVRSKREVLPLVGAVARAPAVTIFDCKGTTSLPGAPVPNPGASTDGTAKRAFGETTNVAKFYHDCFERNSIDDAGMTLVSSIHYGEDYNNAFWDGSQMTYGDGDSQIFVDFTRSNDVIAHELTHGVTQHTAGLVYTGQPGALNESISDVFGSLFQQWEANETVGSASWLIGAGIMGPAAKARGYTCLRDMADPGAKHCLAPQPSTWKKYVPNGDPHVNSGIPNHAFFLVAKALGGKSWQIAGRVWYAALTSPNATATMTFKAFAGLTRAAAKKLYPGNASVYSAVDGGWKGVGI
jgi:Zn-dependent metalloprotease